MPPRQLRLHTLRLSALPFFRSLLGTVVGSGHELGQALHLDTRSGMAGYVGTRSCPRTLTRPTLS